MHRNRLTKNKLRSISTIPWKKIKKFGKVYQRIWIINLKFENIWIRKKQSLDLVEEFCRFHIKRK